MLSRPSTSRLAALFLGIALSVSGCPAPEPVVPLELTQVSFTHMVVLPGETISMSADASGPSSISYEWAAEAGELSAPTEATTDWTAPESDQLVAVTLTVTGGEQTITHSVDLLVGAGIDHDGDGYSLREGDCDDSNDSVYPGAPDIQDSIDNDCDGVIDEGAPDADDDGDGFSDVDGDCDDGNSDVFPGATETANGIDDDCDLSIDEGTSGGDDDGDGYTEDEGDCNDNNSAVSPAAPETLDGLDNDCDGTVDEGTAGYDDDGDGWSEIDGDCNDDPEAGGVDANPSATETMDDLDNDCDGLVDEDFMVDLDGDGWSPLAGDCDDDDQYTYIGAPEYADGADNDCDGSIDEDIDTVDDDGDGHSEADGDCDDANAAVAPDATEIDDTPVDIDNDCDGYIFVNPPVAQAGDAMQPGDPIVTCAPISLDGSLSSDPDEDALDYYWYFDFQPINSELTNNDIVGGTSAAASFTPDVAGPWVVALIVSDGMFNSPPSYLTYSVAEGVCP